MAALKTTKIFGLMLCVSGGLAYAVYAQTPNTPLTEKLTIYQEAPTTRHLDLDVPGNSLGDAYYLSASLHASKGGPIIGEMFGNTTLVKLGSPKNLEAEQRLTLLFFTFNNRLDQIVVAGPAGYLPNANKFSPNQTVVRAIVGGTGKYIGARGQLASTYNPDKSYTQVFTLLKENTAN